jgi:hypothetical protein
LTRFTTINEVIFHINGEKDRRQAGEKHSIPGQLSHTNAALGKKLENF